MTIDALAYQLVPKIYLTHSDAEASAAANAYAPQLYAALGVPFTQIKQAAQPLQDCPPLLELDAILAAVPAGRCSAVEALSDQLSILLRGLYPHPAGLAPTADRIGLLADAALGCEKGTVVYVRSYPSITAFYLLPHVSLDTGSGSPTVAKLTGSPPTRVQAEPRSAISQLTSSGDAGLAKEVATNLAFALPGPWGPVAAASLSLIFGSLFGQSGPNMLEQIQDMLKNAVAEIENFLKDQQYETARKDFSTFLNETVATSASNPSPVTRDLVENVLPGLIATAQSNVSSQHGQLNNTLSQLCNTDLTQISQPLTRDQDIAMSTILTGVTAILVSYHMIARLSIQCAAFYAQQSGSTEFPTQQEVQDDANCQKYLGTHRRAVLDLYTFIHGAQSTPDPMSYDAAATAFSSGDRSAVAAIYGTDQNPDISDFAATDGWAAALIKFIAHRRVARLLQLGDVTYYNNRHTECHSQGGGGGSTHCDTEGDDGYTYTDAADGSSYSQAISRWSSGCCQQNSHDNGDDVSGAVNQNRAATLASLIASNSYSSDYDTVANWQSKTQELLDGLPPDQPATGPLIASFTSDKSAPGSMWAEAKMVEYSVCLYKSQAPTIPSQRSDPSLPMDIQGHSAPKIINLPAFTPDLEKIQIWRSFYFQPSATDPTLTKGLPTLVQELTGATDSWIDTDPATAPSRLS